MMWGQTCQSSGGGPAAWASASDAASASGDDEVPLDRQHGPEGIQSNAALVRGELGRLGQAAVAAPAGGALAAGRAGEAQVAADLDGQRRPPGLASFRRDWLCLVTRALWC
jgi:hypothetical protein